MSKRTYPAGRRVGLSDEQYIRATLDRHDDLKAAVQVLRSSTRLQRLRAAVMAEETHCHICGDEIDRSLPGTHVDGPTLEHLIPVRTPEGIWHIFSRDHVALAHRRCNCGEGDRIQRGMERERVALSQAARWIGAQLLTA